MKKAQPLEAAAKTEKTEKAAALAEPTFTAAQLRSSARSLFGISQSTYDGATDGVDPEQLFTVEAMRKHIDKWLKEEY